MGFIERELDRISAALGEAGQPDYGQLYAAQQALSWALEPTGFKAPYDTIKGIPANSTDCPPLSCPLPSEGSPGLDGLR